MRFVRLDLVRFGPFTDHSLSFESMPTGLHIVLGANEAGKSSALRAVQQFLFGIPHNSPDNFQHPYSNLRIGAVLENAGGERLAGMRRKGRTQTLRDEHDAQPLDPQRLADLLGHVDEAAFCQRFGIDYQELVRGGRAIAEGAGDLGAILFAAGSGIAELNRVREWLETKAAELFQPRGKQQRIHLAVAKVRELKQEIKHAQLSAAAFQDLDRAIQTAARRLEELNQQIAHLSRDADEWQRLIEANPLVAQRDALQQQRQQVQDAPYLAANFGEACRQANMELATAKASAAEAAQALEELGPADAAAQPPAELLDGAAEIEDLKEQLGSHRKAARDLVARKAELQQTQAEIQRLLASLARDGDEIAASRINRMHRRRIQELGSQHGAVQAAVATACDRQRELRNDLERVEHALAALPPLPNLAGLTQAVRQARVQGDLAARVAQLEQELHRRQHELRIELHKLPLWSGTVEALEALAVPATETVDRYAEALDAATRHVEQLRRQQGEKSQELAELELAIEEHRLQQDVPTEDDLAAARADRETGWELIRAVLRQHDTEEAASRTAPDPAAVARFVAAFAAGGDLEAAFVSAVQRADHLADRLRREARQVAAKARQMVEQARLRTRIEVLKAEQTQCERELTELRQQWESHWRPLGVVPLPPPEMRGWLTRHAAVLQLAFVVREKQDELNAARCVLQSHEAALREQLQSLDRDDSQVSLAELCERADSVVEVDRQARQARQDLLRDRQRLTGEINAADDSWQAAEAALQQWQTQWTAAMEWLRLDGQASPGEAAEMLAAMTELEKKQDVVNQLQGRITGIEEDAARFEAETKRRAQQVAPDLPVAPEQPAAEIAEVLFQRLAAARRDQVRWDELNGQRQRRLERQDQARGQWLAAEARLTALCREAGCSSPDQLLAVERRCQERQQCDQQLQMLDDQLRRLARQTPLDEFLAAAGQAAPAQLEPRLREVRAVLADCEAERAGLLTGLGELKAERRRMDGGDRAAEARERLEDALAGVRSDAEEFLRLRMAGVILQRAIERFRERHQTPVLERASELFHELTLGSFRGLRADYNEQGQPVLVGVRGDGKSVVGVQGMSDGTCDQLYLALRLASLENYLASNPPLPFIVDDVLVMFDDDRAVAALKALARLAEQTQVIFFSHHEHLLALAAENLDSDMLYVHRLDHRVSSQQPLPSHR